MSIRSNKKEIKILEQHAVDTAGSKSLARRNASQKYAVTNELPIDTRNQIEKEIEKVVTGNISPRVI